MFYFYSVLMFYLGFAEKSHIDIPSSVNKNMEFTQSWLGFSTSNIEMVLFLRTQSLALIT